MRVAAPGPAPLGAQVVVIAKEPRPGSVKTRLCPPLTADQAAALAEAALADTCRAVADAPVQARVVVLQGRPGPWLPAGFDLVRQRTGPFADRLEGAVHDAFGCHPLPVLVVGMDTPQLDGALLADAVGALLAPGTDAVLGPAEDGGYWCIGTRRPVPGLCRGVPMSTDRTGAAQRARLDELGLRCATLSPLRDVDRVADVTHVARSAPGTAFAAAARAMGLCPAPAPAPAPGAVGVLAPGAVGVLAGPAR